MTATELGEIVGAWWAKNPQVAVEFDPPPSARAITLACTTPHGWTERYVMECSAAALDGLTEDKVRRFLDQTAREMADAQPA